MTVQDRHLLAQEVAKAEGLRLKAYRDTEGVWTIGYGTNLQELEITNWQAEKWLSDKLAESERECERFHWFGSLAPRRQRAVIELVYNLGLTKLLGFTKFLQAMSDRDYDTAALELLDSRWATQVGPSRSQRLADMIRLG